jgi:hypothetical protein
MFEYQSQASSALRATASSISFTSIRCMNGEESVKLYWRRRALEVRVAGPEHSKQTSVSLLARYSRQPDFKWNESSQWSTEASCSATFACGAKAAWCQQPNFALHGTTGLAAAVELTAYGSHECAVYRAEVDAAATIRLDPEHDRYEWQPFARSAAIAHLRDLRPSLA